MKLRTSPQSKLHPASTINDVARIDERNTTTVNSNINFVTSKVMIYVL